MPSGTPQKTKLALVTLLFPYYRHFQSNAIRSGIQRRTLFCNHSVTEPIRTQSKLIELSRTQSNVRLRSARLLQSGGSTIFRGAKRPGAVVALKCICML